MNKEKINQKYLDCILPRIEHATSYADNHYFDKLYDFCMSDYGYTLFYPLSNGFQKGIIFDSFCNLFSHIKYCCDDDGSIMFTYIFTKYKHDNLEKDLTFENVFIMNGEHNYFDKELVLKTGTTHFDYYKHDLKAVHTTTFKWDTIDFLHTLIPSIEQRRHFSDIDDSEKFYAVEKELESKMINYIKGSKNYYREIYD